MNIMNRIRIYHTVLASLSILSYITGELGIIHAWLGYGVAAVIVFRLLWVLSGERQVGLMRFYPSFEGLNLCNAFTHPSISKTLLLGIAVSVILVTLTGIIIDKGESIGFVNASFMATALTDDDNHEEHRKEDDGFLVEVHEFFGNLMLLFVGMHITYLVLFKFPLAKFMLFIPRQGSKDKDDKIE
jgi:cytochrome b